MGVVVAAHHLVLDERVALKFLLPSALSNRESVGRFVREARAAVKIKNEHVARVSDVGELPNGAPYMVMEFLDGSDLSGWLSRTGALPTEQAVDFVLQACEALAEAHALGIVHRDLKPANLFCIQKSDGQLSIKVLDFGISKVTVAGADGHQLTRTTATMGSPLYMSPEQMQSSKSVDARTDIWSLGVILFELMTARAPFDAESAMELAVKVATIPAPPLRSVRPDAPEGLERVVAACLERDRAVRFQTVGELALALRDFAPHHARPSVDRVLGTLSRAGIASTPRASLPSIGSTVPVYARSVPSLDAPAAASGAASAQTAAAWGQTGPGQPAKGNRPLAFAGLVGLVAVAAFGASFALRKPAAKASPALDEVRRAAVAAPSQATTSPAVAPSPPPTVSPTAAEATPSTASGPSASTGAAATTSPPAMVQAPRTPSTTPGASPRTGGTKPATAPPAATAKGACDPPYYFDENGTRLYKKECL
jgi:serine/threonine-protein kinase